MANEILKPEINELFFELIDSSSQKKNTFYLSQTLTTLNRITVLKLSALTDKKVEFHWSESGNCGELNFTFSLVFPLYLINVNQLSELKLVNVTHWDYFLQQTELDLKIYFLARKSLQIDGKGFEMLIQNLPIAHISSSAAHVEFLYKRYADPNSIFCLQTGLDVLNHSGINAAPFKLVNDTPLLSTKDGQRIELRLINCTNKTLNLAKFSLQVQFDVFEDQVKSPQALVDRTTFQKPEFGIDVVLPTTQKTVGSFKKSTASDQSIYRAILDFNSNHTEIGDLKAVKPLDQITVKFKLLMPYNAPGESTITLHYFNIDGYWDGEMNTLVKRTAYYENAQNALVHAPLTLAATLEDNTGFLMPKGVIVMWSGTKIPKGWALCDAINKAATANSNQPIPDLSDRFIVGTGHNYNVGDYGGFDKVSLTVDQMPKHKHSGVTDHTNIFKPYTQTYKLMAQNAYNHSDGFDKGSNKSAYDSRKNDPLDLGDALYLTHGHNLIIDEAGKGDAHENRPPYYALAFIIKI